MLANPSVTNRLIFLIGRPQTTSTRTSSLGCNSAGLHTLPSQHRQLELRRFRRNHIPIITRIIRIIRHRH